MAREWKSWMPLVLLCLVAQAAPAPAEDLSWTVSAGLFNFNKTPTAVEAGIEARQALPWWRLDLAVGASFNEDSASWGHAGLRRDFELAPRWLLTPGFAVALYAKGDGKDLGGTFHFRSSLELARELASGHRLGLAVYHLSNAGFYDLNPGSNSVVLTYTVPTGN